MKRRYLQLDFCNGVRTKELRDNEIETLNLACFSGHHGFYGIEVVGAIFLAHFLRLNNSLTELSFSRNRVQKDGAKALAQSLLGNPQCQLKTVNSMGPAKCPNISRGGKPGIDFNQFRSGTLTTVHLSKRFLNDDDFVFLEEWLKKYDCVTDLDISHNCICYDGVRKLARHVRDTKTLLRLNCVGLPVDLEGVSIIARAVCENTTLEYVALPLGPAGDQEDRHAVLQQLGAGLAAHPTIKTFGTPQAKLFEVKDESKFKDLECARMVSSWPRQECAVYLYYVGALRPDYVTTMKFGSSGKPTAAYPECGGSPPELWPSMISIVRDMRCLQQISIAIPRNYGALLMDLMRALARNSQLKNLKLLGYASGVLRDSQLPAEWASIGSVPRWLLDSRFKKCRVHWQALNGLLSDLSHLEAFNDIDLEDWRRGGDRGLLKTTHLLLMCVDGVAADFVEADGGEPALNAHLMPRTPTPADEGRAHAAVGRRPLPAEAEVESFCDVLRVLHQTPLLVNLTFKGDTETIKRQQERLAKSLSGMPAGDDGPAFTHSVALKNKVVSEALLRALDNNAPLVEFACERLEIVLPALYSALVGKERPMLLERIKIEPKWQMATRVIRKRFTERQRHWLEAIHSAMVQSDRFVEVQTAQDTVDREKISDMDLPDFAELMSGLARDDIPQPEDHARPSTTWTIWRGPKSFHEPVEDEAHPPEPLFVTLPLDDAGKGLRKLSLCMCNLRSFIARVIRPDEFESSSRRLWDHPHKTKRVGDWDEFLTLKHQRSPAEATSDDEKEEAEELPTHHHWRGGLQLGSRQANRFLLERPDKGTRPFHDDLLEECLKSLLVDNDALESLDLRGNGFDQKDAEMILSLLSENQSLSMLNLIPLGNEASGCRELKLDGSDIVIPKKDPDDDYDDEGEPENEAFTRASIEAKHVRLDEGDGFLFARLVTPERLPEVQSVVLRGHNISNCDALGYVCDALISLEAVEKLQLADLQLSTRGARLLLSAVAEMAPQLVSLNGLPLNRLVQLRDEPESGPRELTEPVEWADLALGAMERLFLWPVAQLPEAREGEEDEIVLPGRSLTDIGVKGLCGMLRHFAGPETRVRDAAPPGPSPNLIRIDLSGNQMITDAVVGDLCRAMQHPTSSSLRGSLRELSLRSCKRLHTRSAFELLQVVHHAAREGGRDGRSPSSLGSALRVLNGVDLEALRSSTRTVSAGSRHTVPPMLIRTFVELDGEPHRLGPTSPDMSECDVHFFAGVLHHFVQIPYCMVHIVLPRDVGEDKELAEITPWLPPDLEATAPRYRDRPADDRDAGKDHEKELAAEDNALKPPKASNNSPFPPPRQAGARASAAIQRHIEATRRMFEACPISTPLRVSVVPSMPGCEDLLARGGPAVAGAEEEQGAGGQAALLGMFRKIQATVKEKAVRARKRAQPAGQQQPPRRPLYVNNINSQRLHDCFRTLYGQDDVDVERSDLLPNEKDCAVRLPLGVDITPVFTVAMSVDLQHLELCPAHLLKLPQVTEMPVLTHLNVSHNVLGDVGVSMLFNGLVAAGCNVIHVSASANNIGNTGAVTIAQSLASLPRLTSLELCENQIQEAGCIALAEAVGGSAPDEGAEDGGVDAAAPGPLPVLSVDLRKNHAREYGAMCWAEVIAVHPHLQFLSLADNELGQWRPEAFLGLVHAICASAALSVLDLRNNFPVQTPKGKQHATESDAWGPPPGEAVKELLRALPPGEFDEAEVRQGVFIRRQRGGQERSRRQPQQGGGGGARHAPQGSPEGSPE